MRDTIAKRRAALVKAFVRTWSVKSAVKVVSKEFNVSEAAVRADWYKTDFKGPDCGGSTDQVLAPTYIFPSETMGMGLKLPTAVNRFLL